MVKNVALTFERNIFYNIFYNKYHVITTSHQPQSQRSNVTANNKQFQNSCCKLTKSSYCDACKHP